jgi:hypothetical protein
MWDFILRWLGTFADWIRVAYSVMFAVLQKVFMSVISWVVILGGIVCAVYTGIANALDRAFGAMNDMATLVESNGGETLSLDWTPFLSKVNYVFPLEELFLMLTFLVSLWIAVIIIRITLRLIPCI